MNGEEAQRTILLCKPSAQEAHHTIVQELQSSGLVIERRLFNLTPEKAIALVLQYPSVAGRVIHRTPVKSNGPSTTTPNHSLNAAATTASAAPAASAELEETTDKSSELPEFIRAAQRHRQQPRNPPYPLPHQQGQDTQLKEYGGLRQNPTPDHSLLSQIQLLAQGNRTHPAAAAAGAGLTQISGMTAGTGSHRASGGSPDGGSLKPGGTPFLRRLSASQPSAGSMDLSQRGRRGGGAASLPSHRLSGHRYGPAWSSSTPRSAAAAAACRHAPLSSFPAANATSAGAALDSILDHPALEDAVVRQHVEHLVQDGTNLVLLVRGVDAVERVAVLCGPESVAEARRLAPQSWTARIGSDDVRNAVYAPRTLTEAQIAVRALFKLPSGERAGRSAKQPQQQSPPQQFMQNGAAALLPPLPGMSDAHPPPPITFASLLPSLRAQVDPHQRLSYYTGASPSTAAAGAGVYAHPMPAITATAHTTATTSPKAAAAALPAHDVGQASVTSSFGTGQGELSAADTSTAQMMQATTTTLGHSATARFSSVAPYPQRRERLDEFDTLLQQRAVHC